jgi:hypothetical protein
VKAPFECVYASSESIVRDQLFGMLLSSVCIATVFVNSLFGLMVVVMTLVRIKMGVSVNKI